ncbi:uncharacterized protein [Dysidea avara]|uniref:uncharacterized protein n=1 Tax=Dysidea avara TaxID=196820 RepID=UPI003328A8A0
MDTPRRLSSHDSSPLSSQVECHPIEELCEEEDYNGTASVAPDSTAVEDNSSENDILTTISIERQVEFLKDIQENVSDFFPEFSFVLSRVSIDGAEGDLQVPVLMITPLQLFVHQPLGVMPRIQIQVQYKIYSVHVLMRLWKKESFDTFEDIASLCKLLGDKSQYKFCPGLLQYDQYMSEYNKTIRFHLKKVRLTTFPFKRVDSVDCSLLFQLAHNATKEEKSSKEVKCYPCKSLLLYLKHQKRRTSSETPTRKTKRQQPSSRARMSYMSPASQAKRRKLAQYERTSNIRKLARYEENEIELDEEQNDEMCAIVKKMEDEDLQKLFDEGEKHGVGSILKDIWATDLDRQRKEFSHDQATNCNGRRGNRWSMVTIRMALAIYCRSPAAYQALKDFNILSLPAKSTLQSYSGAFIHAPGASSACITDQVSRYVLFKEQCRLVGKHEPRGDGALIFDEVKVACQLMWNSRNNQLMGLAMTAADLASLNDIYLLLKNSEGSKQTSYVLQFLWRDLTSSFDIVGPYFTCASSVDGKFVLACVLETVKLFQCHGLQTSVLVCDGGSSNIATIKACHGHHGAYSVTDGEDKFEVKPWMINPFNPPNQIFWLICPSHQLKNMINALFSSKIGGSKQFQRTDKCTFGWEAIDSLYQRELERAKQNLARMVPRLKETHVLRDAWTKLNVHPAKIMQQEQVLGELYWYANQEPTPPDAGVASETLEYLEACSRLFEKGFLSHDCVRDMNSDVIKNINEGFSYFTDWLDAILQQDPKFPHTSSTQRSFLSWQTWDLLRIDVYGFRAFSEWFFKTYPTYFISLVRLSGSAAESLFSQYKHNAGGKLDSVNYCTARAAHLVKQTVSTHHSGKGYRDENLNTTELPLRKKTYNKHNTTNNS